MSMTSITNMSTRRTIHQASRTRIATDMSGLNIHIHTILTFTIAIHTDRVHYADEGALHHCRLSDPFEHSRGCRSTACAVHRVLARVSRCARLQFNDLITESYPIAHPRCFVTFGSNESVLHESALGRGAPQRRDRNDAVLSCGRMAEPSAPNILEVAKRAGVSTATVSRVLSRPNMVSAETRRRVMKAR